MREELLQLWPGHVRLRAEDRLCGNVFAAMYLLKNGSQPGVKVISGDPDTFVV
jgi:hypothetical protein